MRKNHDAQIGKRIIRLNTYQELAVHDVHAALNRAKKRGMHVFIIDNMAMIGPSIDDCVPIEDLSKKELKKRQQEAHTK